MSGTINSPVKVTETTLEELQKIHSGKANAESPHLAVPLYMPLAPSISFEDVLPYVDADHQRMAKAGKIELIAIAHGTMCDQDRSDPLQLVLYKNRQGYWTFGTCDGLIEMAVLMGGDGRRYLSGKKLDREEAVRQWMSGFLSWNCECPGLYRLRYAMIESADK
jgi:hypothetical protein